MRARGRRLDVVPDVAAARGHHAQRAALLEDDAFPADPRRPRDASRGRGRPRRRQSSTGFERPAGQERRRCQDRERGLDGLGMKERQAGFGSCYRRQRPLLFKLTNLNFTVFRNP